MLLFVYGPYMNPKYLIDKGINFNNAPLKALLYGYEICFSTKTCDWKSAMIDIKEKKDGKVEGVLYDISDETINFFDDLENVNGGKHSRINVLVETIAGLSAPAYTYFSPVKDGNFHPSPEYIDLIIEGAQLNKLSPDYIDFIKSFYPVKKN